jgi:hypothetical protein
MGREKFKSLHKVVDVDVVLGLLCLGGCRGGGGGGAIDSSIIRWFRGIKFPRISLCGGKEFNPLGRNLCGRWGRRGRRRWGIIGNNQK